MRLIVSLAAVALVAAAAGAADGQVATDAVTNRTATFLDSRGETADGPDIDSVIVSSEADELALVVAIPTQPALTDDARIRVWLDADDNRRTGLAVAELRGADRFLLVDRWELGFGEVGLFSCSHDSCAGGKVGPDKVRFSYAGGRATFIVTAGSLGVDKVRRLRFWVEVWTGIELDPVTGRYVFTDANPDFAPDGAGRRLGDPAALGADFWSFEGRALLVRSFSVRPSTPRAGALFTLRLAATRTDAGAAVTSGTVSCSAKIGGAAIKARSARFAATRGTCVFAIPADARGKSYRATIAIQAAGATVLRSVSGKVG
jgi:hypothetical protein